MKKSELKEIIRECIEEIMIDEEDVEEGIVDKAKDSYRKSRMKHHLKKQLDHFDKSEKSYAKGDQDSGNIHGRKSSQHFEKAMRHSGVMKGKR